MSSCSKLRRLTRGDDADNGKMFPDWASLHPNLVEVIGCMTTSDSMPSARTGARALPAPAAAASWTRVSTHGDG